MKHLKTLLFLSMAIAFAGCVQGGGMEAPEPPDDPGTAPEPPARSTKSKLSPGDSLEITNYPKQKTASDADASWGTILKDIEEHLPSSYGSTYRFPDDKDTWGHETSHGIHAHLRNYWNKTGKKANAFYVLNDKAVIIVEPNVRKSDAAPFIPSNMHWNRYSTYITGQVEWDDTPMYIFDEWNAYVNGASVAVELESKGLWTIGWQDGVAGPLEFTVYGLALAMAVEAKDPTYFSTYPQFKEFVAYEVRRSMDVFRKGRTMKDFTWDEQDAFYEKFKTSSEAGTMRDFATKTFGAGWVNEVLWGAPPVGPVDPSGPDAGPKPDPTPPDAGPKPDPGPVDPDAGPVGGVDDEDNDGVPDEIDVCSKTAAGANVWMTGEWIGCAGGQRRDGGVWSGSDGDGDGIVDKKDRCTKTPAGKRVWTYGEWVGCAGGEVRDK
ncbi:MAG: thrombospondin type 3 repeat-containing protein [Polyangiales bacterium]